VTVQTCASRQGLSSVGKDGSIRRREYPRRTKDKTLVDKEGILADRNATENGRNRQKKIGDTGIKG
jgi:hypothetical protein